MDIYFSDYFNIKEKDLVEYGALNISLVADLPLFIDPFLLFNSKKNVYQDLHKAIIKYLIFLKSKANAQEIDKGALKAWYVFKEVEQNWLGFSVSGNKGSALGIDFGRALHENLHLIFNEFGEEKVTKGSHLEKLCLIREGVGKDNISDFATNLIKEFLLQYTQTFTKKFLSPDKKQVFRVPRVRFNYQTEVWEEGIFELPKFKNDFVILTPTELLTKDNTWINKHDLIDDFESIPYAISNDELRFKINNYFLSCLPKTTKKRGPTKQEKAKAAFDTIQKFPELIDYFIKFKEDAGPTAEAISTKKVQYSQDIYIKNVKNFLEGLQQTDFFKPTNGSHEEALKKIHDLKDYIENNEGYRLFYHNGERVKGEKDLQLLFGLICHESSTFDINREVNNGRGPVDFKFSKGRADKTLIEFKLASGTKLEQNLLKQIKIYDNANKTKQSIKVIIYFTEDEFLRATNILKRTGLYGEADVVLIDGRQDNKPSASNA